jgi:hypothetical protein
LRFEINYGMLGGVMSVLDDNFQARGLKHFKRLMPLLHRLEEVGCQRDKAGNRLLTMSDYCAAVLLYLWNPTLNSIRMLQEAVGLAYVAKAMNVRRFSLGSFSESSAVFDPSHLKKIIDELAGELVPLGKDPRLSELKHALTLVDSTVLEGLCRLANAACEKTRYRIDVEGRPLHGWRLHTQLDLQTFCPHHIERTGACNAGENREARVLLRHLESNRCYVGDGGYAVRYLLEEIVRKDSSYIVRTREDSAFEVREEQLLSQEALDAGVVRDILVRPGQANDPEMNHAVRVVVVQVELHPRRCRTSPTGMRQSDVLVLMTSLLDLPAELIALIYRYRYSVELFFRFFKQLLGMRHLLSQRPQGVDIQVYCAVTACLLINLQTGKKPSKLMASMMGWYLLGIASEQEMINFLNRPDNTGIKKRAKDELWKKLGVK